MNLPPAPDPDRGAALLRGPRILLRRWRDSDRPALAAIHADPLAMQHFPGVMSAADSNALAARLEAHFAHHGFGPWALEIPGVVEFAGFVGLLRVAFEAHFTPAVEVGWRMAPSLWGQGYATEAAQCALAYGFTLLDLPQIVSFTVPANHRSLAVMQRLGMHSDPRDDFQHPRLPPGHPLRLHQLYRISRQQWLARQAASGNPVPADR